MEWWGRVQEEKRREKEMIPQYLFFHSFLCFQITFIHIVFIIILMQKVMVNGRI